MVNLSPIWCLNNTRLSVLIALFIFKHSSFSLVNKLFNHYFPCKVNILELLKTYFIINFVNLGNDMIGTDLVLISAAMSTGCFKLVNSWVIIDYLNLMYWTLYHISVGNINTFQTLVRSYKVTALIPDWIYISASSLIVSSPLIVSVVPLWSLVGTRYLCLCWWKSCFRNDLFIVEFLYVCMFCWYCLFPVCSTTLFILGE